MQIIIYMVKLSPKRQADITASEKIKNKKTIIKWYIFIFISNNNNLCLCIELNVGEKFRIVVVFSSPHVFLALTTALDLFLQFSNLTGPRQYFHYHKFTKEILLELFFFVCEGVSKQLIFCLYSLIFHGNVRNSIYISKCKASVRKFTKYYVVEVVLIAHVLY